MKSESVKLAKWITKTTLITVLLIAVCFSAILVIMIQSYEGGTDLSKDVIGDWNCVQFYKNQKSFLIPDNQEVTVKIDESGVIKIQGSNNASIFRGERAGTYTIDGGNILTLNMGESENWACPCAFTKDGLLRLTVPEMEVVLYLQRKGGISNDEN